MTSSEVGREGHREKSPEEVRGRTPRSQGKGPLGTGLGVCEGPEVPVEWSACREWS